MFSDRYDNPLTTSSEPARGAYSFMRSVFIFSAAYSP